MQRDDVLDTLAVAGIEVYRDSATEVQLAERVRVHLMDSGVSVRLEQPCSVSFAIRCQRSDYAGESADALFERVRSAYAQAANAAGFREAQAQPREIRNPVDEADVLDVWYEVRFVREVDSLDSMRDAAEWALRQPKCVQP